MIEIIMDASQIEQFEACPRKWYNDQVLNLTSVQTNTAMSTGTWFHEVLKLYETEGLLNPPVSKHIKKAVDFAVLLATGPDAVKWPRVKKDPKFHLDRLRAYLITHMAEDDSSEIVAVEKGFSTLLYEDAERRYILEGMIDLISIERTLGLTVTDHKSQSRAYEKYWVNHQVNNYLSFTGARYFRYNYIGQQATQNDQTFRRPIYRPHPGALEQWRKDVLRTFQEMERYLTKQFNPWIEDIDLNSRPKRVNDFPKRLTQCQTKFGLCQFHKLCELPDDSPYREVVLKHYKQKEPWKAWS